MIVLDCENTDSIYTSLEAIAGANREAIELFLKNMDLDSYYGGSSPPPGPGNEFLLDAFRRTFSTGLSYDATCWFHLTRTEESCIFDEGILPVGQRLDSIFDWLYRLFQGVVSEEQWNDSKRQISREGSWIYKMKSENPGYWGPFAMLVRDLAFKPSGMRGQVLFLAILRYRSYGWRMARPLRIEFDGGLESCSFQSF